jgi:hypothetical protein
MSRYLLDTRLITAYLRGRRGAVALIEPWVVAGEAATSIIVYGEVIEYFKRLSDFTRGPGLSVMHLLRSSLI